MDHFKLINWIVGLDLRTAVTVAVISGFVSTFGAFMHWNSVVLIPFEIIFIGVMAFIAVSLGERYRIKRVRFTNLSGDERAVLTAYIGRDVKTIPWTVADTMPKSLFSEGVLYKSHDMEGIAKGFNYYTIQDWAFRYLKNHSDLLKP